MPDGILTDIGVENRIIHSDDHHGHGTGDARDDTGKGSDDAGKDYEEVHPPDTVDERLGKSEVEECCQNAKPGGEEKAEEKEEDVKESLFCVLPFFQFRKCDGKGTQYHAGKESGKSEWCDFVSFLNPDEGGKRSDEKS